MIFRKALLRYTERTMASRPPDFEIGPSDDRYMLRWYLTPWSRYERGSVPKNWLERLNRRLPNAYVHRFLHDDEDRALHSHPWKSCSIILENGYWEVLEDDKNAGKEKRVYRAEGTVHFRGAKTFHRVVLEKTSGRLGRAKSIEVITLFLTGFVINVPWGFKCPQGFRPWYEFVSARDKGSVGRGCE